MSTYFRIFWDGLVKFKHYKQTYFICVDIASIKKYYLGYLFLDFVKYFSIHLIMPFYALFDSILALSVLRINENVLFVL